MKKVPGFLCILFVSMQLAASSTLFFGMGNDKFTNGISENSDDYLSFSVFADWENDDLKVKIDESAYTNRKENLRTDRLEISCLYNIDRENWSVKPYAGFVQYGNHNLQNYQNQWHKFRKVPVVDFGYDRKTSCLMVGVDASWFKKVKIFTLGADLGLKGEISQSLDGYLSLFAALKDYIKLSFGYELNSGRQTTLKDSLAMSHGIRVGLDIDMDTLRSVWIFYPQTMYGYGQLSVDLLGFEKEKTWEESDIFYKIGISRVLDMQAIRAGFSIPFTKHFSGEMGVDYVSGFPIGTPKDVRSQRNYGVFSVGVNYHPFDWIISPYVELDAGIGVFQINYLRRYSQTALEPDGVFITDLKIGTTIVPEGKIVFGDSTYQLDVFAGTKIIPGESGLTDYIKNDMYHDENFDVDKYLNLFYGCTVKIGLDG